MFKIRYSSDGLKQALDNLKFIYDLLSMCDADRNKYL